MVAFKGRFVPQALHNVGDPTDKYYALRELFAQVRAVFSRLAFRASQLPFQYVPIPPGPVPKPSPKEAYGTVQMDFAGTMYDNLKRLVPNGPIVADYPMTFELLKQAHGFVLYRTIVQKSYQDPVRLDVPGLKDRATVLVNQVRQLISLAARRD